MERLHATYQALKDATDHLYNEISNETEKVAVGNVRQVLDTALRALEDELGITKARVLGSRRKKLEDATPPPQLPAEPSAITEAPGDIAAKVNDEANRNV